MVTIMSNLALVLRFIACVLAAILFVTGLVLIFIEPGWSSAQYIVSGIYLLVEAFLLGIFRRNRMHVKTPASTSV